jgi:hypothetical protein
MGGGVERDCQFREYDFSISVESRVSFCMRDGHILGIEGFGLFYFHPELNGRIEKELMEVRNFPAVYSYRSLDDLTIPAHWENSTFTTHKSYNRCFYLIIISTSLSNKRNLGLIRQSYEVKELRDFNPGFWADNLFYYYFSNKNRGFTGLNITQKQSIVSPDDGIICRNMY